MAAQNLVTAKQLERMGGDFELVRGKLVPVMTPAGWKHGRLAAFLAGELETFMRAHELGWVYVEVGYQLFRHPDTVRGPDVSFVSRRRGATARTPGGFLHGAPDLAIEIASADKSMTQLTAKAREYIEAGTPLVWVMDPRRRKVRVHRPGLPVLTLSQTDALDGAEVLPGFRLPLSRLFAELDD